RGAGAAGRPDHLLRRLSEAGARPLGRLGDGLAGELREGARARQDGRPGGAVTGGRRAMNQPMAIPALLPVLPEMVLAVGAMALLMYGVYGRGTGLAPRTGWVAVALLVLVGVLEAALPAGRLVTFGGSFVVDNFARVMKVLALAGSAAAIVMSPTYLAATEQDRFEYPILILLSTVGMMLLSSAADLIALY